MERLAHAGMPEAEGAMLFEAGHHAKVAVMHEVGHPPLDGFLDVGARGVDELAEALEDRLRERGALGDVGVDLGVTFFMSRFGIA